MELTPAQKQACREAADYISEHGWYQGSYFEFIEDEDGDAIGYDAIAKSETYNPPACALGALAKATRQKVDDARAEYAELLGGLIGKPAYYENGHGIAFYAIQHWNDHPDTTAEDVILKLKEAGS